MIIKKTFIKYGRRGRDDWAIQAWYLFGIIPIYVIKDKLR